MNLISQNALNKCDIQPGQHLLIAVSGGQDSMVLAFALAANGYKTTWAHCNFGLRGDESNRDEEFVRNQAEAKGIDVRVRHFSKKDFSDSGHNNTQAAARHLRYQWFEELRQELSCDAICVAHHADDQVETLFMNLVRGTGIDGLTGMAWRMGMIARPLLEVGQQHITEYALKHNIEHITDSSNASTKYKRNKFRHEVLPVLRSMNPNLVNIVLKEQDKFQEQAAISMDYVEQTLPSIIQISDNQVSLNLTSLQNSIAPHLLLWHFVKGYGFSSDQSEEISKLIDSQTGKFVSSKTHTITRNRNQLVVSVLDTISEEEEVFHSLEDLAKSTSFEVKTGTGSPVLDPDKSFGFFDLSKIRFPLTLRTWVPGDKFIPLGMGKQQKISDFLTQAKVNSATRGKVKVLVSDGKIIWVLGHRIGQEVKIESKTTDYLLVRVQ